MFLQSRRIPPWTSRVREKVSQFSELVVGAPDLNREPSAPEAIRTTSWKSFLFNPFLKTKALAKDLVVAPRLVFCADCHFAVHILLLAASYLPLSFLHRRNRGCLCRLGQ